MAQKPTFADRMTAIGRELAAGPSRSEYAAGTVRNTPESVAREREQEAARQMQSRLEQLNRTRRRRGVMREEDVMLRMMEQADPNMPLSRFFVEVEQAIKSPRGAAQMTQRGRVAE